MKECHSSGVDELESEGKQAKSESFLLLGPFYVGCHQKEWPRFRVGLPTSNDPIKKNFLHLHPKRTESLELSSNRHVCRDACVFLIP